MNDLEGLGLKLNRLGEHSQQLRRFQMHTRRDFRQDVVLGAAVCRYLHIAVELALDIGELVVAGQAWIRPDRAEEVMTRLGEKGVLPSPLARRMERAVRFRHLLVHEYTKLDWGKVEANLKTLPDQLESFARHVSRFVRRRR